MTLSLDHVQRLYLIVLLDSVECPGRREAWHVCKLQDQLMLNEEEKQTIGLRKEMTEQGERYAWDSAKSLPLREYPFGDEDIQRICRALDKTPIVTGRDRWFRALNAQLPEPVESNGQPKT